jgi:hypothetical protein
MFVIVMFVIEFEAPEASRVLVICEVSVGVAEGNRRCVAEKDCK